jgi:hypothetical protein
MNNGKKAIFLSQYKVSRIIAYSREIRDADVILFMPKTAYYKYSNKYEIFFVKKILSTFFSKKIIIEIDIDSVIGHYWTANYEASKYLFSIRDTLELEAPNRLLYQILKDDSVVNYFQGSLTPYFFYEKLCLKIFKQQKNKYSEVMYIGSAKKILYENQAEHKKYLDYFELIKNLILTARHLITSLLIPIYFLLITLLNGFKRKPTAKKPILTMPILNGINKGGHHVSKAKGVKYSNDDKFIYSDKIRIGDVVHIFEFWSFDPHIKKEFIDNMNDQGISYLDSKDLKMNVKSLKMTISILLIIVRNLFNSFRDYNNREVLEMNSFLPKAILHILKKHLEVQYVCPSVDLIRNDYNPASFLRAIVSKKNSIKTIGIQHTATPHECPQLSFVNFDYYLLFGNIYKRNFSKYLIDTKVIINGKDFLDSVIRLKNSSVEQDRVREDFKELYGKRNKKLLIILPGNTPTVRKYMRQRLVNVLTRWCENITDQTIIIRFRKRIEIDTVNEWSQIYSLSMNNKNIIVDFDNFTTQELIYISDRVIIPHASYSMTESLALNKDTYSFDYSGQARYFFDLYGSDLVITSEEDLYQRIILNESELSSLDIDFKKLSQDLDAFYDGKNVSRLEDLIIDQNTQIK